MNLLPETWLLVSSYLNSYIKTCRPGTILFIRRRLFHSYNFTFSRNVRVFVLCPTTDQSEVALLKTTSQWMTLISYIIVTSCNSCLGYLFSNKILTFVSFIMLILLNCGVGINHTVQLTVKTENVQCIKERFPTKPLRNYDIIVSDSKGAFKIKWHKDI